MSYKEFILSEERYIESVAKTAGVDPGNVKVLSINEISTREFTAVRLLLATAVRVQTSVLLASTQRNYIENQTLLNSNLNKNSLPSCTLVVQSTNQTIFITATPAPNVLVVSIVSGNASASYAPIPMIVGGIVGFVVLTAGAVLIRRFILKACPLQTQL